MILVFGVILNIVDAVLLNVLIWSKRECKSIEYDILSETTKYILLFVMTHFFIVIISMDILFHIRNHNRNYVGFMLKIVVFSTGIYLTMKDESLSPVEFFLFGLSVISFTLDLSIISRFLEVEPFKINWKRICVTLTIPVGTFILLLASNYIGVYRHLSNSSKSIVLEPSHKNCECSFFDGFRLGGLAIIYNVSNPLRVKPYREEICRSESHVGLFPGLCGGRQAIVNNISVNIKDIIVGNIQTIVPGFIYGVVDSEDVKTVLPDYYDPVTVQTCNYFKTIKQCDVLDTITD